jgi:hypothetical protein
MMILIALNFFKETGVSHLLIINQSANEHIYSLQDI